MKYLNALLQEAEKISTSLPEPTDKTDRRGTEKSSYTYRDELTKPTEGLLSVLSVPSSRSTENFNEQSAPLCSCGIPASLADATETGSQIYRCHQCGYAAIVPQEPGRPYTLTEEEEALHGGFYAAVHFLRAKLTTPQPIASLIREWAGTGRSLDVLMEARWALKVIAYEGADGKMWWTLSHATLQ